KGLNQSSTPSLYFIKKHEDYSPFLFSSSAPDSSALFASASVAASAASADGVATASSAGAWVFSAVSSAALGAVAVPAAFPEPLLLLLVVFLAGLASLSINSLKSTNSMIHISALSPRR